MKKRLAIIISIIIIGFCFVLFGGRIVFNGNSGNPISNETGAYTVTFYSNDDTILKIDSVKEASSATPPVTPLMTYGTIFKSWDTDFSNVTKDLDIRPVCEDVQGKKNVLAVHSAYSQKGNMAVVPIQLCGDVCVSGLDITIRYDHELLKLESIAEDKAVVYNDETPGIIRLNYVSSENTVADVDLCNLSFLVEAAQGAIPITVEVNGIYAFEDATDYELFIPESSVIDGNVFVYE